MKKNWTDCAARLEIGGSIVSKFPTPELVINEMELMYLESESSDPPEIVLEYVNRQGLAEQLVMAIAFHSLMTPRWILYHSSLKQPRSLGLLATGIITEPCYEPWTCHGTVSLYLKECLLDNKKLLTDAISWFLYDDRYIGPLIWIPYDIAVKYYYPDFNDYSNS